MRVHATRDVVVQKDALLEKDVHLVVGLLAAHATWLLEDVQIGCFLPAAMGYLVSSDRARGDFLRQQVSIRCHKTVNVDLAALHVDTSIHAVIRHRHLYHLICIIALVLL